MFFDTIIYWLARSAVAGIQSLPLDFVGRLGRAGGGFAFHLTSRYRRVAMDNLTRSFPKKTAAEIREIAKENFRRLGKNYASAIKTAAMNQEQLRSRCEFVGAEKIRPFQKDSGPQNRIIAIGHFGNFELYARSGQMMPGFKLATTYRGLNQPGLNQLLVDLRNRANCLFYERRTEFGALKTAMNDIGLFLGLFADQHAGKSGLRLPFLGRDCSTTVAPAVFALRYNCPLHTAICYRVGLARWRIEIGEEISTRIDGNPRSIADIMLEVNQIFETAVLHDPANWFWVHRRWKPPEQKASMATVAKNFTRVTTPKLTVETASF